MGAGLTAVLTAIIVGMLMSHSRKTKPAFSTEISGTIKPGKTTAWLCVVFFGVLFVASLIAVFTTNEKILYSLLAVMSLGFSGFMAPSLGKWHDLSWNENGVEGACKMFGPSLSKQRTFIAWQDVTSTGMTATQYWYIETKDKRRIYWSYLYRGHISFRIVLAQNCPNLTLPY